MSFCILSTYSVQCQLRKTPRVNMASSRIAHLRDAETAGRKYSRDPPVSHSRVLHLDTLDVNVPPDLEALACTEHTAWKSSCNSYYPSLGSRHLREVVTRHVSSISGCCYTPDESCIITSGGSSSGLLDILISTVGQGDEVILLDPTYREHFNRVLLTGAKPILAPFQFNPGKEWTFDAQTLRELITAKTRVMLLMSPSFPCGGYLTELDWQCVAQLCLQHDLILIVDSSMERLVFDSRPLLHPAGLPGMAERTITLGSASKELRMIGWRVGWIVGPAKLITKISAICQTNTMAPAGIVQEPVALALERSSMTLPSYVEALQARRDLLLSQLRGLSVGIPSGGWGLFLRVSDFGRTSEDAYADLLNAGVLVNVGDWICNTNQYVCLIFSNVALQDLEGIGKKIRTALNVTTEE